MGDDRWGPSAERTAAAAAEAGPPQRPVRFVQVGTASGTGIALPGAVLRSSSISLMGSGLGSVSLDRLLSAIGGVFAAAAGGALRMESSVVPLEEVAQAWSRSGERIVFAVGAGGA